EGRQAVNRQVEPPPGPELRSKSSALEEHAKRPPSGQVRHFRCSERKESGVAPHIDPVTTATRPPARESIYYTPVGKCAAPEKVPAKTRGTPCLWFPFWFHLGRSRCHWFPTFPEWLRAHKCLVTRHYRSREASVASGYIHTRHCSVF